MSQNFTGTSEGHETTTLARPIDDFLDEAASSVRRTEVMEWHRFSSSNDLADLALDSATDGSVHCLFIRQKTSVSLRIQGRFCFKSCAAGGWLMLGRDDTTPTYWLPAPPMLRRTSAQGHILEESAAELVSFDLDTIGATVCFSTVPHGWSLDIPIWRIQDSTLVEELQAFSPVEVRGYFLLGSHTRYAQPADLYRHLIHGLVYEDRYAWPHKRRICSENDAHALYLVFRGLHTTTGKRLYRLLAAQLLLAVLSRQSDDGGYRHGEWTDHMESHYRLHCSAMHLMMDALTEADDPAVRRALEKSARFIADKHDLTKVGAWFYHDELELSKTGMDAAPFKWIAGNALGKAPQNMLVLNTHLDVLIALDRYRQLTGDEAFDALVASGQESARAVLAQRPAEWLYRLLFSAINLTLLPTTQAMQLPLWNRIWKRVGWQLFIPRLYQIKNLFPRLVMPGGYIDRHLAMGSWAFHYLTVNIMDLVRARRRFGGSGFDETLTAAARFTQFSGVRQRWKELKYERYALGFWAEALWHLMKEFPESCEYPLWYGEACADLEELGMGLPPSSLGGNSEAACSR